ncbi:hypothetical protein ES703_60133 [subsurface metagenome]
MDLKVRRAFSTLVQEVSNYIDKFGGFDLELYGLTQESMKDINELPMIVELAKVIMRFIRSNYTPNWNSFGYFFWEHGKIMENQVTVLEPIAEEMVKEGELDISEILSQIPTPKILPDGIDYQKYDDIFNQLTLPNAMFQYIFVCENILRKFIIQVLDDNGYQTIDSIGNQKLSKAIQNKKNKETTQNYLPIRGDHDIYYLDLIELNKIFIKLWNECFIDKFERQSWICERIESLYTIRNRVAHSSGYLTSDELRSVETRCREIIKQIDQNIK